jgi:hypothetical protein
VEFELRGRTRLAGVEGVDDVDGVVNLIRRGGYGSGGKVVVLVGAGVSILSSASSCICLSVEGG